MAALSVSAVRARVAAALEALPGWHESEWAYEFFGSDPDERVHLSFSVGVPDTNVHPREGRQRLSEGALVDTSVEVAWAYRLGASSHVSAYDSALAAEQAAVQAVVGMDRSDLSIVLDSLSRKNVEEGWVLGTLRFRVIHRYALS